jgi:hypothetical protein
VRGGAPTSATVAGGQREWGCGRELATGWRWAGSWTASRVVGGQLRGGGLAERWRGQRRVGRAGVGLRRGGGVSGVLRGRDRRYRSECVWG